MGATNPAASQIMRVCRRAPVENRSGITNRYRVVVPIRNEQFDFGHHKLRRGMGSDANLRGSLSPVTGSFMCLPPTSGTRTFTAVARIRGRSGPAGFSFARLSIETVFTELTGFFQNRGFGRDHAHEFIPGFDE